MWAVAVSLIAVAAPSAAATRRGAVAFHYARDVTPSQLEWFSRFDVLVTHDPLPAAQVAALHARGTRLVLYEWAVAFYESRADPFAARLLANRQGILNRQPLRGGLGSADAGAYYYDPASPIHAEERARAIARRLREVGYDGVFLDTTTAASVHPDAMAEYRARHPDVAYDVAFARFMKNLRRALKSGLVITNQGYRAADDYLPYADVDVTESLITHPAGGGFRMRAWNDPADQWNSIDYLMRNLIAPAKRRYPRVRFVHVNYIDAPSDETLRTIDAIARLFGDDSFVALPAVTAIPSDVYFVDLGRPRGAIERRDGRATRRFAHGVVTIDFAGAAVRGKIDR